MGAVGVMACARFLVVIGDSRFFIPFVLVVVSFYHPPSVYSTCLDIPCCAQGESVAKVL